MEDKMENRGERMDRGDRGDRGGGGDRDRGGDRGGPEKRGFGRRKGCRFCQEPALIIDHKDKYLMQNFVTERFKIVPRRISGTCAWHQRSVTLAVKRARHIAFIPYTTSQM